MGDDVVELMRRLTGTALDDAEIAQALQVAVDVCGGLEDLRAVEPGEAGPERAPEPGPGPRPAAAAGPGAEAPAGPGDGGRGPGGPGTRATGVAATDDQPLFASLSEVGDRYRSGDVTPYEFTAAMLERIARVDPVIRAWSWVDEKGALEQAERATRELARGTDRGALHGIPVGVKDLIDVAGLPCTAGSRQFEGRIAPSDAACVAALRSAGGVVLGKVNTHEFAFGGTTPPTRNPWTTGRIPGGSSGGSAAALATGTCTLALGTDTAGSIRIPAALCGISGLMPSLGRSGLEGIVPLAPSLDMVGPMARTAGDLARAVDALSATGVPGVPARLDEGVAGLRLGVLRDLFEPAQPDVLRSVDDALDALQQMGAALVDVRLRWIRFSVVLAWIIMMSEAVVYHRRRLEETPERFDPDVRSLLEAARFVPASSYVRALQVRGALAGELETVLGTVDALVLPTVPCTAAPFGASRRELIDLGGVPSSLAHAHVRNTAPFNLARLPAGSQMCGLDRSGLPVGLQVVGRAGDEAMVLRIMRAVEAATLVDPRAPLPGGAGS